MAAVDPVAYDTVVLTGDLADDGTLTDMLTEAIDDDTDTGFAKCGKGGTDDGDAHRAEFADLAGLTAGDTISFWAVTVHQIDDGLEIQAYTDFNSVTATGAINIASPVESENVYTITQAFIDELGDVGSGNFAVRLQPRSQEAGDVEIAECDADLTPSAAPTRRIFVT